MLSKRVASRLSDLTRDEAADLWATVHEVVPKLQTHFKAEALTIAVQDGPAAGQSVPHVHVHVLPRRAGDFKRNDDIYSELEKAGALRVDADEERKPRTIEEMAHEARTLRPLFTMQSLPIPEDAE